MTTIDKIRAEIDKWDDSIKDAIGEYADGMRFVLRHFTFVLDTLEEPASEDLEEELENYYGSIPDDEDKINAARHFAEWGAEHLRDSTKMISEDLEDCLELNEAADAYVGNHPEIDEGVYTYAKRLAFKAGAEWQKDKDTEAVIVAEDRGFLKGADWARAKMMEDGK